MELDLELNAQQEAAVEYMLRPESDGAALLAFDMGLGKTRTACMFAKEYGAQCVLIVVPLQTIEDWESTAQREYPDLDVKTINSTKAGKTALADFEWRAPGIYLVTHQYWEKLAWKTVPIPKRSKKEEQRYRKVDSEQWAGANYLLIFDESHRSANVSSWTHRALMNIHSTVFKLSLSGTFMGDRFDGAYGATRWLWPHRTDIIPTDIFAWRKLYAETKYDRFAPRNEKTVGELDEGAFVSELPCYIRMESDQPPAIAHEVWVTLYPEQRRVYDELDDRMVAWINDNPLVAEYSITKRIRQRQTTLAFPTIEFSVNEKTGDEDVEVWFSEDAESAKIDALHDFIDGKIQLEGLDVADDETLLILTDSQKFARVLTKRLDTRYGEGSAREWSGKVTRKRRKEVKADFIEGNVRFLVGVQSAMGTGTDGLQYTDARIVVFMSRADRRIDNEQGVARLNRKGQQQEVHVVSFMAEDTIDTGQWSNQMIAAVKAMKIMRAKYYKEKREEEARERLRKTQQQGVSGF